MFVTVVLVHVITLESDVAKLRADDAILPYVFSVATLTATLKLVPIVTKVSVIADQSMLKVDIPLSADAVALVRVAPSLEIAAVRLAVADTTLVHPCDIEADVLAARLLAMALANPLATEVVVATVSPHAVVIAPFSL